MSVRIINADVMDGLRQLGDESVHCVVTSPPYYALRDYGVDGQIGIEASPEIFVARMVEVFSEIRRVLRKDGTCWMNMGDSYNQNQGKGFDTNQDGGERKRVAASPKASSGGLPPKNLLGMPWRLAFALQADGWWLRSDIIWAKPNPMPESVTDRPTKSHEYVFLLTRSERYFYDAEAIKEAASGVVGNARTFRGGGAYTGGRSFQNSNGSERESHGNAPNESGSRNKRSVWTIATSPFPDAHFATFPPELPEICILAGTSQKGCCAKCGAPWGRETETIYTDAHKGMVGNQRKAAQTASWSANHDGRENDKRMNKNVATLGWSPSCSCNADVIPATVLDPFSGAGTTCLVADRLQRNAIGIELNPTYAAMSERRINGDRGGLLDLMEAAQ